MLLTKHKHKKSSNIEFVIMINDLLTTLSLWTTSPTPSRPFISSLIFKPTATQQFSYSFLYAAKHKLSNIFQTQLQTHKHKKLMFAMINVFV